MVKALPATACEFGPKKFFHCLKNWVISKSVTSLRDTNKKSLSIFIFRVKSQTLQGRQQYKKLYPFQTLPKLNTKFLKAEVLRTLSQYFIQIAHHSVDLATDTIPKFHSVFKNLLQILSSESSIVSEVSDCLEVKRHFPIFLKIKLSLKKSLDPKFWNYPLTKILKWFRSNYIVSQLSPRFEMAN